MGGVISIYEQKLPYALLMTVGFGIAMLYAGSNVFSQGQSVIRIAKPVAVEGAKAIATDGGSLVADAAGAIVRRM